MCCICVRFPVCAMGVLRWVDHTVSEPSYFKLNTDHTPLHLVLVDEVNIPSTFVSILPLHKICDGVL